MATDDRDDGSIERIRRITDVGEEPLEFLSAITGYEEKPIISIEAAIEPLVSVVPLIQSQTYNAKKRCQNPANGLTQDEAASIMLYTMSWEPACLFTVLNATLRMKDRKKLIPWFSYMKLFFVALDRLPSSTSRTLFRGVKLDLSDRYEVGKPVVWWGCSSCTVSEHGLDLEEFLGKTGKRTKFIIDCNSGKDIGNYSYFVNEDEVLILPGTEFEVIKCCEPEPDLYEIHLKEVQPLVSTCATDGITLSSQNPPLMEQPTIITSPIETSLVDPTMVQEDIHALPSNHQELQLTDSSSEDHEQFTSKDSKNESREDEQRKQSVLEKQKMISKIQQEWLRKEKNYIEQLEKIDQQLSNIPSTSNLQKLIQQLIFHHRNVYKEIERLNKGDASNSIKQLSHTIETLMQTLSQYEIYISLDLVSIKKVLDKRMNNNTMSTEGLLSILPKQFLQIVSQVQDLYETVQSFEFDDQESLGKLKNHAQQCTLSSNRQDENINKIILKNEDVISLNEHGNQDHYHLFLHPDAIVCCYIKTKLLSSSKYAVLWIIPLIDLQWTIAQSSFDDNTIRKPKNKNNIPHSNLRLSLSNSSSSISSVFLFSSAYQLQDWIDLIHKTKQEIIQRSSDSLNSVQTHYQRLTESLIQKRLEHVKPNSDESSSIPTSSKTYSGRLDLTIHSIHGSALLNPIRRQPQTNYQVYVAIEIDRYNTFYPYAQTAKESMQQQESVEFKDEVFDIELENSLAFRLLVYRTDTTASDNTSQCIGKVHQNIESALCECAPDGTLTIESPPESDDIKLKISIKYSKHADKSTRQESTYNCIIFGKSIGRLMNTPNACINGIPRIIVKCTEIIDRDGLKEIGIYRVCRVASDLQNLRQQFNRDYYLGEEMLTGKDSHFAANLLKLFLRELPELLFPDILYEQFLQAVQLTDMNNQRDSLLKTFELLHCDNRKILIYLFDHLIRVSQYSDINKMNLENLAVIFGQILMRPPKTNTDSMPSELQGSLNQNAVVLTCLKLRQDGILK